jgi:hypothetical protein
VASHEKSWFPLKNAAFWDLTLCSSCEKRRFGEICRLHFEGKRASLLATTLTVTGKNELIVSRNESQLLFKCHDFRSFKTVSYCNKSLTILWIQLKQHQTRLVYIFISNFYLGGTVILIYFSSFNLDNSTCRKEHVYSGLWNSVTINKTNSVAFSPQTNYTERATAICQRNLVPTFVDRGCRVVSAPDPLGC